MSDELTTQNDGTVRGARWLWAEPQDGPAAPVTDREPVPVGEVVAQLADLMGIQLRPAEERKLTSYLENLRVVPKYPCPAHGDIGCADCSRLGGAVDGSCSQCSTFDDPECGFHWDTCANRDRNPMQVHQDSGTVTP